MVAPAAPETPTAPVVALQLGPGQLFIGFSRMALSGFGGVMPFAYRFLVETHAWVTAEDFAQMFAFGQILPGPTICNISVMIGWRKARFAGAVAALSGLLVIPTFIVIFLGVAYQRYGTAPGVQAALAGMSAVAAGLIVATAVKMAIALFKARDATAREHLWLAAFAVCAFLGVGLLRWPLVAVVAVLGPTAILLAFWKRK